MSDMPSTMETELKALGVVVPPELAPEEPPRKRFDVSHLFDDDGNPLF